MNGHVLAIDQGTTSTRAIVFDSRGEPVSSAQLEHRQWHPKPGWVEHDALEIWENTQTVLATAISQHGLRAGSIAAIGITNQRETAVVWDPTTGIPISNAIVWQDTRTQYIVDGLAADGGSDRFASVTGLPLSTYFSATKISWLLDHVPGARDRAEAGDLLFGTMDSWLLWNLTGGVSGGVHATDVTNASRTQLMSLVELDWDDELLAHFGIPRAMLPAIRSSSEVYGYAAATTGLEGVPVAGILGDQQAAAFGQGVFTPGDAKNTYGTGCFLLVSTGEDIVHSRRGLLTTVAYRLGDGAAHYALEGSVAVAGSLVQWLRDNLNVISSASEIEPLAASVDDNGGVYMVPAFSGLLAPHWRSDARGAILGLTGFATKAHIARAALESTAFQTRDVLEALNQDADAPLTELRVDGGMAVNAMLMQFQADILNLPVVRPAVTETTAVGAAYVAGLAVGFWDGIESLRANWREGARWHPRMNGDERRRLLRDWDKAVTKSLGWIDA